MMKQTHKSREEIIELIGEDQNIIFYDGIDDAIIGLTERIGMEPIVAYDVDKVIEILVETDGMTHEEAIEHYEYNIIGGYVGELTPVFIKKIDKND